MQNPPRTDATVLVVEDESSIRTLIIGTLQGAGFSVLGAVDGPVALDLLAVHPAPVQLLITDFKMPGMTGGELIRRAAQLRPEMKFLCISGHSDLASAMPEVACIEKPFTLRGILVKVRLLLGG